MDKKHKVLVVDDDPDMIDSITSILEIEDIEYISVNNGKKGVETAGNEMPDLILMDIDMPGMNGFEACEAIKNNSKTTDIPIIFLTSKFSDVESKVKGFATGAVDYLTKPFVPEELLARVKSMLKLRDTHVALQLKNEHYMKMVDFVAHEIKQPVTCIVGAADTFRTNFLGKITPDQKKMLDLMERNTDYITTMIDTFLNLSKVEEGKIEPKFEEVVFFEEVLKSVLDHIEPNAVKAGKKLEEGIIPDKNIKLKTDANLLKVVLNNLFANAIKYSSENAVITYDISVKENRFRMSITNPGEGIPADKIETIFKRFERIVTKKTKLQKGTGLGLFITREIVEKLNGKIWCESKINDFVKFSFFLPLSP